MSRLSSVVLVGVQSTALRLAPSRSLPTSGGRYGSRSSSVWVRDGQHSVREDDLSAGRAHDALTTPTGAPAPLIIRPPSSATDRRSSWPILQRATGESGTVSVHSADRTSRSRPRVGFPQPGAVATDARSGCPSRADRHHYGDAMAFDFSDPKPGAAVLGDHRHSLDPEPHPDVSVLLLDHPLGRGTRDAVLSALGAHWRRVSECPLGET